MLWRAKVEGLFTPYFQPFHLVVELGEAVCAGRLGQPSCLEGPQVAALAAAHPRARQALGRPIATTHRRRSADRLNGRGLGARGCSVAGTSTRRARGRIRNSSGVDSTTVSPSTPAGRSGSLLSTRSAVVPHCAHAAPLLARPKAVWATTLLARPKAVWATT